MSHVKSLQQKVNGGSSQIPVTSQSVADQMQTANVGLPEPLSYISEDAETMDLYNRLGNALLKYSSLFQEIDSFELSIAANNLSLYLCYAKVVRSEGSFITEAKSHTAKDKETGKMPTTIKAHPAVRMMRDAQSDFEKSLTMLGLDLRGRATIFAQMSMVKAVHGKGAANIHLDFMSGMVSI